MSATTGKNTNAKIAIQLMGAFLSGAEVISVSAPKNLVYTRYKTKRDSKTNHDDILLFYA